MQTNKASIIVDYAPTAIQHFRVRICRCQCLVSATTEAYGQFDFTLGELIALRGGNVQGKLVYGNIYKDEDMMQPLKVSVNINAVPLDGPSAPKSETQINYVMNFNYKCAGVEVGRNDGAIDLVFS